MYARICFLIAFVSFPCFASNKFYSSLCRPDALLFLALASSTKMGSREASVRPRFLSTTLSQRRFAMTLRDHFLSLHRPSCSTTYRTKVDLEAATVRTLGQPMWTLCATHPRAWASLALCWLTRRAITCLSGKQSSFVRSKTLRMASATPLTPFLSNASVSLASAPATAQKLLPPILEAMLM